MKISKFLLATILLLTSIAVWAEKPDPNVPNPPLQVLEHNVDDVYGAIRVHEQGTVGIKNAEGEQFDVNVTGGSINANITGGVVTVDNTNSNPVPVVGTVTVDNFPGQQGVWADGGRLSSVNEVWADVVVATAKNDQVRDFDRTIDATHITVSMIEQEAGGGDEFGLMFFSPLVPGGYGGTPVLRMVDYAGELDYETLTFSYPIPLYGLRLYCANEAEDCSVAVTVFGFTGD